MNKVITTLVLIGILILVHAEEKRKLTNQDINRAIFRSLLDQEIVDPLTYHTLFDPQYDYDFTNRTTHHLTKIGKETYKPPFGWHRIALNVNNKYDNGSMVWLGYNSDAWPVSYHGTSFEAIISIIQNGFDLTKTKRYKHGKGHYTATNIEDAAQYSPVFEILGRKLIFVLQVRVNPKTLKKLISSPEYWLSAVDGDVRSYHISWKEIEDDKRQTHNEDL